jgi:radical SAM protein with 4Fe4S-binding SPASM domain
LVRCYEFEDSAALDGNLLPRAPTPLLLASRVTVNTSWWQRLTNIAFDRRSPRDHNARRFRLEAFGAILQSLNPRALIFVDRDYASNWMRRYPDALTAGSTTVWKNTDDITAAPLTAPLEAHLQLTNKCNAGCKGCYTGASPQGDNNDTSKEWQLEQWTAVIDELAAAGVFHVALGGGESAVLPWLGDLAEHCWRRGIVPNLTTSGLDGLEALLPIADRFGQINVSLDGLGDAYATVRGFDGFARADAAIRSLRAIKRDIGINVVVTRHNFAQLDEIFAYARAQKLSEVELLRYKPSGRGARGYHDVRCTDAQHQLFLPTILAGAKRHRVRVKVDCSYTPMLAFHNPGPGVLAKLAVFGCTGGDFLVGAKAQGQLTACSFAAPPPVSTATNARPMANELRSYWNSDNAFGVFRQWRNADEPCRSCSYLSVCRSGCRVVAAHAGNAAAPDPECPTVVNHRAMLQKTTAEQEPTKPDATTARRRLPVIYPGS